MKFLADENISTETIEFLKQRGFDIKDAYESGLQGCPDEEIVSFASREKRIILTFDLDFGEIYYFREKPMFGAIVLRVEPQIPAEVNNVIEKFLSHPEVNLDESADTLIILDKEKFRIRRR